MKILFLVYFFLLPIVVFADVKIIEKEDIVPIPDNQSRDQVVEYTKLRLARQASEEAGIAIFSSTQLVDGKISKEQVIAETGSIAQVELIKNDVERKADGRLYAVIKVKVKVNTETLNAALKQAMQNDSLRKDNEQLRKEKLALEEKIKNAGKDEYNKSLSGMAQKIAAEQEAKVLKLSKDITEAKRLYLENEKKQKDAELAAKKEMEAMEREYASQNLAIQKQILSEQDAVLKAELEHKANLKKLTQNALLNDKNIDTITGDTVEFVEPEVKQIRTYFSATIKEFNLKLNSNKNQLETLYKSQIKSLENKKFPEVKPEKQEWEETNVYKQRLIEYEERKKLFYNDLEYNKKQLTNNHKKRIEQIDIETKKALISALEPMYKRLVSYTKGKYRKANDNALISFGDKNVDNKELEIKITYHAKSHKFIYKFDDIAQFRSMYETKESFRALPLYAFTPYGNGAKAYLHSFKVVHLGNNKEKIFPVEQKAGFPEEKEYEDLVNSLNKRQEQNTNIHQQSLEQHKTANTDNKSTNSTNKHKRRVSALLGVSVSFPLDVTSINTEASLRVYIPAVSWLDFYVNTGFVGNIGLGSTTHDSYWYDDKESSSSFLLGGDFGLGINIYLSKYLYVLGEINGLLLVSNDYDDDNLYFGGLYKAGAGLQFFSNERPFLRTEVFIEDLLGNFNRDGFFIGVGFHFLRF